MTFVCAKEGHEWTAKEMGSLCIYWSEYKKNQQQALSSSGPKKAWEADKANNSTHSFKTKYRFVQTLCWTESSPKIFQVNGFTAFSPVTGSLMLIDLMF